MQNLSLSILSFLGEYLELREIAALARTCKKINNQIKRDLIYFHYTKKRYGIEKLPPNMSTWLGFLKEYISLKWKNCGNKFLKISENGKRITSNGWACAISDQSFQRGKHFFLLKIVNYNLGFLGISFPDTPLTGPCFGEKCFAYSSFYKSYR